MASKEKAKVENTAANEEAVTEEAVTEEAVTEEATNEETTTEEAANEETTTEEAEADDTKKNSGLQAKIDDLNDRLVRQLAEFENFRNRSQKEKSQMFDMGAKSVIEKMLPIVDNFERGFAGLSDEALKEPFAQGMSMVYKQLMTEFEKMNVKPIEAVGTEFNPDFHQAVMHIDDESVGENIIVEELQKGYTYNDTVVRYSMVKVAN